MAYNTVICLKNTDERTNNVFQDRGSLVWVCTVCSEIHDSQPQYLEHRDSTLLHVHENLHSL